MADGGTKIDYRYLDMDCQILYKNYEEYKNALRDRSKTIIERAIINYESGQVLLAGGEEFTELEAVLLCKRLSG